ncbi:hypothetical protein KUP86_004971 [Salmonella enterica]|nr:hypothetical protein [Salmonella enterica]
MMNRNQILLPARVLLPGAVVIQFTGMAEPSWSGSVFEVVRRPAVTGYIRCRYERPVATLESDVLAQGRGRHEGQCGVSAP